MPTRPRTRHADVAVERWPTAGTFTIARGAKTEAVVVVATVTDGTHIGRGEACPYARYGETVEGVVAAIHAAAPAGEPLSRSHLLATLPPGAARNALDCALIDLEARQRGVRAAQVLGLAPPGGPLPTCYTISLAAPEAMAEAARAATGKGLLKLKLGGGDTDAARLRAVRAARPDARLVADANEAWSEADLEPLMAVAADVGVEVVEQPLPAGADGALGRIARRVPVCADESAHTVADLAHLAGLYDAVNIKLDKAGGLTAAVVMADAAAAAGLDIMVGCMLATSLAMAPAWLLAPKARWLDLDGPLLLARDRLPGIRYERDLIHPPPAELWG